MTTKEAICLLKDHEYWADFSWMDEVAEVAIAALEKAEKYAWHDLRKNADDLPECGEVVLCEIYGSDIIICKEGETLEEALERIRKRHHTTAGWYDKGEGWTGLDGFPMMVTPSLWKRVEPYEEDKE